MHIYRSKKTTDICVRLRSQSKAKPGKTGASSSSTMQEAEAEDSGADTEEDSLEDWAY